VSQLPRAVGPVFARDPISGENAPAGRVQPATARRAALVRPLGLRRAGKSPPPPDALRLLQENCAEITGRQLELETIVPSKARNCSARHEIKSMEGNPTWPNNILRWKRKWHPGGGSEKFAA